MMSRWKRAFVAARQPDPPPGKPTVRETVAIVVAYAVIVGVMGLFIGDWQMVIGGGVVGAGTNLLSRWRRGRTARPEYEDVDGGDE
ncbi:MULTISPECIES: hypothetical protein [unclassified Streptomyces]|uniref:hypothetical protein n=1 Tax=unclassified Streptomyces TaxID=2593676 RepID=UPI002E198E1B|nr:MULTISPECIES: hypothetical protein [unclassified Streptomyces]